MRVAVFLLFIAFIVINAELPKIRFEYKYSFKGPHLVQKDHSIPFWEYNGGKVNLTCRKDTCKQKHTCTFSLPYGTFERNKGSKIRPSKNYI